MDRSSLLASAVIAGTPGPFCDLGWSSSPPGFYWSRAAPEREPRLLGVLREGSLLRQTGCTRPLLLLAPSTSIPGANLAWQGSAYCPSGGAVPPLRLMLIAASPLVAHLVG